MPADVQLKELLESIQTNGPQKVVQQYRHNLLPSRTLIDLYNQEPEFDVLLFLALYPTVPSQILEDLIDAYPDPVIRAAAANNPRCSQIMLLRMAEQGGPEIRKALAANRFHSPKVTADLINDPHLEVRAALAQNSAIKPIYQMMLLQDPEPAVRVALSGVSRLSDEILHSLSADESAVVRACTYARSKAPDELLSGWAQSDSPEIQRFLIQRKKLPAPILRTLQWSPDPIVQEAVDAALEVSPEILLTRAESGNEETRLRTAQHTPLPESIQHILAEDPAIEVRTALAASPGISEETALCIATSTDLAACQILAENPALPAEAALELCHHDRLDVRLRMAYRNDLTEANLDVLVNQNDDIDLIGHLALRGAVYTQTSAERLEQLLKKKQPTLRQFAARSEHLTPRQKRQLISDPAPIVRLALCDNPSITRAELDALSADWNPSVAAKATTCLQQEPMTREKASTSSPELKENNGGLVSQLVRFFTDLNES